MAKTKSAKKALRQTKTRHAFNLVKKNILKSDIRKFRKFITTNQLEQAKQLLPSVYQKLDKAAKTNLIKQNTASRLKSRLSKKLISPAKTS